MKTKFQKIHGHAIGVSGSRTYRTWKHMLQRCNNPRCDGYLGYGARGITVCERWMAFANFLEDMGERPEGKSIDRIDGTLGYYKENCRWADPKLQATNRRAFPIYRNNSSGLVGVGFDKSESNWQAYCYEANRKRIRLYRGKDFFAACCARKSWEVSYQSRINNEQQA